MIPYLVVYALGIFSGAVIANKNFRNKLVKQLKKLTK